MGSRTFSDLRVDGSPLAYSSDAADTTPPTDPTNLAVVGSPAATSVTLTWTASTDNVAVAAYNVYQDSALVATVTNTQATISSLTADTLYVFEVSAVDTSDNESGKSIALNVTTASTGSVTYQQITSFTHENITIEFASAVNSYVGLDGELQIEEGAGGVKPVVQRYSPPWQVMPPTADFNTADTTIDEATFRSQFVNGAEVNPSLANKAHGTRETTNGNMLYDATLRFRTVDDGGTGELSAGDKLVITTSNVQGYRTTYDMHNPLYERAMVVQVHANGSLPTVPSFRSGYTSGAKLPVPDTDIGYEIFTNSTLAPPDEGAFPTFATASGYFARINASWINGESGTGAYFNNSTQYGMVGNYRDGHERNRRLGEVLLACLTTLYTESQKIELIRQVFRFCDDIYEISKTGAPCRWADGNGQTNTAMGPACFVRATLTNDSAIFADILARWGDISQEHTQAFYVSSGDLSNGYDGVSVFQKKDNEIYFFGPQVAGNAVWREKALIPTNSGGSIYGYALDNCIPKWKWVTPYCDILTSEVVGMPNLRTQWNNEAFHDLNDVHHVKTRAARGITTNAQLSSILGFTLVNEGNVNAIGLSYDKPSTGVAGFYQKYRSQFGPAIHTQ